jgi:hypothetical protein
MKFRKNGVTCLPEWVEGLNDFLDGAPDQDKSIYCAIFTQNSAL